jgi:phosphoribosylanthranilate isomerase
MPVRVKICGVTTPADLALCGDAGADAVGINFHPSSPRYVDPHAAPALLRHLPPFVDAVGVFVERPLRQVYALGYQLGLRGVQWYGPRLDRDDSFPFQLIPAFRVRDAQSLEEVRAAVAACREAGWSPAAVLLDSFMAGQHGGTGRTAPWELLIGFDPGVPVILAGGLTPENVAEAVRTVQPYGVDVASGVESAPGRKDPQKVRRFIDASRTAR